MWIKSEKIGIHGRILMVAATMVNGEGDHDYGDDRETEEDSHLNLLLLEPAHDHR